jgi:hypothetical protein
MIAMAACSTTSTTAIDTECLHHQRQFCAPGDKACAKNEAYFFCHCPHPNTPRNKALEARLCHV